MSISFRDTFKAFSSSLLHWCITFSLNDKRLMLFFLFLQLIIPNQIGCRKTNRGGEGLLKLSIMHAVIISILPSEVEVMVILLFQYHFRSCSNDQTINGYCNFLVFWHLIIPNRNELPVSSLWKEVLSNPNIFVIKSTNKIKSFIWNIFYCASTCIYVRINVAIPNVIDSHPRRIIYLTHFSMVLYFT